MGRIYGCGCKEVYRFSHNYYLSLLLVSALVCSIPTFCSFFMFFVLITVLFCNLCKFFSRSIYIHIRATTGFPRKLYDGLHITKKHTQTNVSNPVMDVRCMPSRAGCRSRSRGRALYRNASRAAYWSRVPDPTSQE